MGGSPSTCMPSVGIAIYPHISCQMQEVFFEKKLFKYVRFHIDQVGACLNRAKVQALAS